MSRQDEKLGYAENLIDLIRHSSSSTTTPPRLHHQANGIFLAGKKQTFKSLARDSYRVKVDEGAADSIVTHRT